MKTNIQPTLIDTWFQIFKIGNSSFRIKKKNSTFWTKWIVYKVSFK